MWYHDGVDERRKWAFWAFCLLAAAVILVPTSSFVTALERYGRFLNGFEPMRPTRMRSVPHQGQRAGGARLDFVEFRYKAPKATQVELVGDFNGWKPGTLRLTSQSGAWEVLVPLPPGRYRYRFLVDGTETPDPAASESAVVSGRRASVKEVR